MIRFRLLCLLVCLFVGVSPGFSAEPEASLSGFRPLLDESEYQSRASRFSESMESAKQQAATKLPALGLRLGVVEPDGQAAHAGLEPDDYLVRVNDRVVSTLQTSIKDIEGPRTLQIYQHRHDRLIDIEVEEGLIGVRWMEHWKPELEFLRSENRGSWDRHVLLGCLARESDPDLAETAWHRALQAGYSPDTLSLQFGIYLANKHYRSEEALRIARQLDLTDQTVLDTVYPYSLYLTAFASSDMALLEKVFEAWPYAFEVEPELIAAMRARQEKLAEDWETDLLIPSEAVKTMYADDLLPRSRAALHYWTYDALPKWQRGESVQVEIDTGHYRQYRFGPPYPVPNFEFRVRFTVKRTNIRGSRFAKAININLKTEPGLTNFDRTPSDEHYLMSLRLHEEVEVDDPGTMIITDTFDEELRTQRVDRNLKFDGETVHELRILRCGGMGEMLVDGKRVYLSPIPEEKGTGFYMQLVGITAEILEVKCVEYIERE